MILVRHGESEFNVVFSRTRVDPGIPDPALTANGRRQAREAAAALGGYDVARIVSSPYRRALETAGIIAERLGVPVEVDPLVRERGHFVCDIGTPASRLAEQWPGHDFSHLDEIWWQEAESEAALRARCIAFRHRARRMADWRRLVVVAHWAFIRGLTGTPLGNGELLTFDPTRDAGDPARDAGAPAG